MLVPPLRFPGFTDEWKKTTLGEITTNFNLRNKEQIDYPMFSVTNNRGFIPQAEQFEDREMKGEDIKAYKVIHHNDFAYNPARINVGSIAKYNGIEPCMISSLYVCFKANNGVDENWLMQLLRTPKIQYYYQLNGEGGVRIYLFYPNFARIRTSIPSIVEQKKIAKLLSIIDERIATQNKIIEDLKKLKSAIRKMLFANLIHWPTEDVEIGELLNYEQPSNYIVESEEYVSDVTKTPVLTANKGFILGYTEEQYGIYRKGECIIFDDFTMDAKYVTFPFKVKSSAIKILTATPNVNLRFMFEYIQSMNLKSDEHKRHYLSEIATLVVTIPIIEIQNHIACIIDSLDRKLTVEQQVAKEYEIEKQYLLSNMFI